MFGSASFVHCPGFDVVAAADSDQTLLFDYYYCDALPLPLSLSLLLLERRSSVVGTTTIGLVVAADAAAAVQASYHSTRVRTLFGLVSVFLVYLYQENFGNVSVLEMELLSYIEKSTKQYNGETVVVWSSVRSKASVELHVETVRDNGALPHRKPVVKQKKQASFNAYLVAGTEAAHYKYICLPEQVHELARLEQRSSSQ